MKRSLALVASAAVIALAACDRAALDVAPRRFMQGGVWWPHAAGYWLHQYAERDEVERLMDGAGFACRDEPAAEGARLVCERGFRWPLGVVARRNVVEVAFRKNGVVAAAQATCAYALFDVEALSGTCDPFAAPGAVYPDTETFAAAVEAMLAPARRHELADARRLARAAPLPLPDAQEASDRLARWRFECDPLQHRSTTSFTGNRGDVVEMRCRQWSLRTGQGEPQRQDVVVRYDTADLAVLGVEARLDGASRPLSKALDTQRKPAGPVAAPGGRPPLPESLALTTLRGDRIDMPMSAVGTGSRDQTREGFVALTPDSQRALVAAYLDKQAREWQARGERLDRLSYLVVSPLEWYGPRALPHLDALMSDDRPLVGARSSTTSASTRRCARTRRAIRLASCRRCAHASTRGAARCRAASSCSIACWPGTFVRSRRATRGR